MKHYLQILIGIFTIDKGKIKVLLTKKKEEPYKGYWILPSSLLDNETLEDNVKQNIQTLGLPPIYTKQTYTYSTKIFEIDCVSTVYLGLIDNVTYSLKLEKQDGIELEWFDVLELPKIAYDHEDVINELYLSFKKQIVNSNILKILFPSDFTLPEVQKIYEQVLDTKLDRRNFRKKLITLGYISDTGDINDGYTGRPAKLYRFNDKVKERDLF